MIKKAKINRVILWKKYFGRQKGDIDDISNPGRNPAITRVCDSPGNRILTTPEILVVKRSANRLDDQKNEALSDKFTGSLNLYKALFHAGLRTIPPLPQPQRHTPRSRRPSDCCPNFSGKSFYHFLSFTIT